MGGKMWRTSASEYVIKTKSYWRKKKRERLTQYSSHNNARQAGDHYSPRHLRHQSPHPRADPHHWWPNPHTILLLDDGGPGTRPSPSPLMPSRHTQKIIIITHKSRNQTNKQITPAHSYAGRWKKKRSNWVQKKRELKTMLSRDEVDEVDWGGRRYNGTEYG